MQVGRKIVLGMLRVYKAVISPWLPPSCRYVPSCSEYVIEAVERYGSIRGALMAVARVLRCHPFVRGGYDPVLQASHAQCGGDRHRIVVSR